jgi:hypothetical protein
MTPDEKTMIAGLFDRIGANQEPAAAKDRDAEALIRERVARDPGAAYTLVQMALVQEHALKLADERIRELESGAAKPAAPEPKKSFLDGLMPRSPWARKPAAPAPAPGPQGGSFLRSAFVTAAGVAGGLLLFNAIRGLMAGESGAFGESAQAAAAPAPEIAPPGAHADAGHSGGNDLAQDGGGGFDSGDDFA